MDQSICRAQNLIPLAQTPLHLQPLSLQLPKHDRRTVLRVQKHEYRWRVLIGRGQLERESLEYHGHRQPGLQNGQVLTHAPAGPHAERHEGHRVLGCVGHPLGKPSRVELVRVVAPKGRVVVDSQDRDQELGATRDVGPAGQLYVHLGTPDYGHGRRV
ncbi:4-hydroxy-3-methylbut-2-en-1-yl diphosphatesynthase [Striga asiatica]|uniref:4-hydroxy-3-methylbut-2-en-1-yl diphosphatesynthase n=1 Tax=Striga asiatica TaxID=4170 RepID=A0A5A7QGX5_STRAF|nr:4-hydroxy-3-methylbut-2-en-1-yl diphosphatesynthase [Striga asiatica]